jgi:hypothetical protein
VHANDMILVSVDDHLVEPPNLFEGRLPGKFADAAPRVLGSMCFPSFPGFAGRPFATAEDKELALAVTRACNDWYAFDPFAHRTRAQCAVGALRAEAGDHDVAVRSYDTGRFERSVGVSLGAFSATTNV